ncbi:metalloendopeptidase, partial [Streptomyces sp. ZEA17I]
MPTGPNDLSAGAVRPLPGLSRRGLLAGLGLGALTVGLSAGTSVAGEAEAEAGAAAEAAVAVAAAGNGAWAGPAQGRFPAGGHYGAPRGGGAH